MKKYKTEEERLEAIKKQKLAYYEKNKSKILEKAKINYNENKEEILESRKEYQKEYNDKNKEVLKDKRILNKENIKSKSKKYYQENKESIAEANEKYREANKDKIKKLKQENYIANKEIINKRNRDYYLNNKEAMIKKNYEYQKLRQQTDPLYKLRGRVRNLLYKALKRNGFSKVSKSVMILGCSFQEFKNHLESKFEPWMNWENYGLYNGTEGHGWDIDHIEPLANTKSEEDIIRLNHYTNLQPLCSYMNRNIKRDNIDLYINNF